MIIVRNSNSLKCVNKFKDDKSSGDLKACQVMSAVRSLDIVCNKKSLFHISQPKHVLVLKITVIFGLLEWQFYTGLNVFLSG